MAKRGITFSIITTLLWLFVLQIAIVLLVGALYGVRFDIWGWYVPVSFIAHQLITFVLYAMRGKFYTVPDHKKLLRLNFTNALTLFRISSTPTLIFFMVHVYSHRIYLATIIFVLLIFLTDFLDGKIARMYNQATQIGKHIDSWGDYFILLAIGGFLQYYAFISYYFFIAIIVRFTAPIIGVLIRFIVIGNTHYHQSWFGKASVFGIMFVMGFSIIKLTFGDAAHIHEYALKALEIVTIVGFIVPALLVWGKDLITGHRVR